MNPISKKMRPNCGVLNKIQTYRLMRPIMRPVLWKMELGFGYSRPVTGTGGLCTIADQFTQNTGSAGFAMDTTVGIQLWWSNPNVYAYAYAKTPSSVIVDSQIRLPVAITIGFGYGPVQVQVEPGNSFGAQLIIDMVTPTTQTGTFTVINMTTGTRYTTTFSITP